MTMKLKVGPRAALKVEVLPKFPGTVSASTGIIIVNSGGNYTISIDADALVTLLGLPIVTEFEATQAQAEAGTSLGLIMSPLRVRQAIAYQTGNEFHHANLGGL